MSILGIALFCTAPFLLAYFYWMGWADRGDRETPHEHELRRLAGPIVAAPEGWTHSLYCIHCGQTIHCISKRERP